MKPIPDKTSLIFLFFLPSLGEIVLLASHYSFEGYLIDRLLPLIISLILVIYLGWQHYTYWDKYLFRKPYVSPLNSAFTIGYGILLVLVLTQGDLQKWYSGMINSALPFYFFPFILSGYVVPFLLFSHVLSDSLERIKRFKFTASAHLIIALCFIFWWLKNSFNP